MTGKMGNKLCGCDLSLNKTLLSLISFILPLRVPVTYVAWLSAALCVVVTMLLSTKLILRHLEYYGNPDMQKLLALTFVGWATTYIDVFRD